MTLKATDKRIGCVVDAGNNVALRWEGERNVLIGRLSPEAAERLADDLRAAAEAARERAEGGGS